MRDWWLMAEIGILQDAIDESEDMTGNEKEERDQRFMRRLSPNELTSPKVETPLRVYAFINAE